MKKRNLLLTFIAGAAIVSLFGFKMAYDAKKNTAEVENVQGLYIFMSSKPVSDFEYLGTVDCPKIVKEKQYDYMMPLMVKRAKEKFPNCDAVIFKDNNVWVVDAIKFK